MLKDILINNSLYELERLYIFPLEMHFSDIIYMVDTYGKLKVENVTLKK